MARMTKARLLALQRRLGADETIGRKLGVTRQAVHQMRKRLGIVSRRVKNPERNARVLAMYEAGRPARDLAERFAMSVSQTYRVIGQLRKRRKKKK
jgi:Mor family transcriptional regulator